MKQYKDIDIYTEEDFAPGCTIAQARHKLEASAQQPSLLVFGTQLAGVNISVGEHTRAIADIISALTPQNDADASGTPK